jgi:tetratricopeptide (TPR) repeat protein
VSAWMLVGIAIVACAVYANSLYNGFAFDDVAIVKDNIHVKDLMWNTIWTDNYWPTNEGIQPDALYRPLTLWTYLANEFLTPGAAWAFHLVNVLLHALVSVLVTMLSWRILGNRKVAIVAGLIFAVHPLHTEAVSNVVGRAELLAACWTLLALLIYLPQAPLIEEKAPPVLRAPWHGVLVALCFIAAILSKETPVTLLLAIPLIDAWRFFRWEKIQRPALWRWAGSRFFRYYLPLGIFFTFYLAARINACGLMSDPRATHPIVNPLVKATIVERIVTPFGLFAQYLKLTAWPVHLSADYSAPSIMPTANPFEPLPLLGILVIVLAGIMSWRHRKTLPALALVLGLFFTAYILVANFLRIGTIFGERLFYWPSAFVILLVAWAGVSLWTRAAAISGRQRLEVRAILALLFVAAMVGMSMRTWIRNTDWEDNIPLAIATGRDNPMSAKACHWAGTVLIMSEKPEHVAFAMQLLERAVELYPSFAPPQWEIAKYYGRKQDLGNSLVNLCKVVRLDPGTRDTRVAMGGIMTDLKKADPKNFMPIVENYFHDHPQDPEANLAMAMALHAQGKYTEAETFAEKAVELGKGKDPNGMDQYHEAAAELATIRYESGQKMAGINLFREYVKHVRSSVMARCNMAELLMGMDTRQYPNAYAEAEMNLDRAQSIDPRNAIIRETRAKLTRAKQQRDMTASALPSHEQMGPEPAPAAKERMK